jgi:hypothetical protein
MVNWPGGVAGCEAQAYSRYQFTGGLWCGAAMALPPARFRYLKDHTKVEITAALAP